MNTAQEMIEITNRAQDNMVRASKDNSEKIVMTLLYPDMKERAEKGYTYCEVMVPAKYRGIDSMGAYLWITDGKGKNEQTVKAYINDIIDYLKELEYEVVSHSWSHVFYISWKKEEK